MPTILNYQDQQSPATYKHWYWLGAGTALWITWQISTAIGIFFGAQLPEGLGLEFTLALTFIGIVVPTLTNKPTIAAALSAGLTAIATYHLPYKLNLMAAALVGIAVGLILEQQSPISNPQSPISNPQSPLTTHDHE